MVTVCLDDLDRRDRACYLRVLTRISVDSQRVIYGLLAQNAGHPFSVADIAQETQLSAWVIRWGLRCLKQRSMCDRVVDTNGVPRFRWTSHCKKYCPIYALPDVRSISWLSTREAAAC